MTEDKSIERRIRELFVGRLAEKISAEDIKQLKEALNEGVAMIRQEYEKDFNKLKQELEGRIAPRKEKARSTEPTRFFEGRQIKKDVYEYAESKDVYVEGEHTADLCTDNYSGPDKQLMGVSAILKQGREYYIDKNGGALISKLKQDAVEKARGLAKSQGYDAFLLEDSNVKWDVVEFEKGEVRIFSNNDPSSIKYGVTAVVEFYRRKEPDALKGIPY